KRRTPTSTTTKPALTSTRRLRCVTRAFADLARLNEKRPDDRGVFFCATDRRVTADLLGQQLADVLILEHTRQGVAQHVADQLGIGLLVGRHAETLVKRRTITAGIASPTILHLDPERGPDIGFGHIEAF